MSGCIRFEHHLTAPNVEAGEQARWLPRRRASGSALPGNDYSLFDGASVVFHHFAGDGELAPDHEEFTGGPNVVKPCVDAFEARWALAVDHTEYTVH